MKRRRVKITGLGFVTPAGIGKEEFHRGILKPISYVTAVKRFPEDAGPFVASEVKRFHLGDYMDDRVTKRLPRHTQFALAATMMALADAGLTHGALQKLSPVIVNGTALMDSNVINQTIENVAQKGPRYALARVLSHGPGAMIAASIAENIGGGRILTLESTCCAGSDAIGHATAMVAAGECDIAICGGTEAPIYYHPMLELKMAGLSPSTNDRPEQLCRPFDMWRTTGVIGEGACILVLEPESSPRPGYAFISGYSFATDLNARLGSGLLEAIRLCMGNAGVRAEDVDLISAWGPGHREIDASEARVLKQYFGDELRHIPVVSIKGAIGNPFAAAGAIQTGCTALGLRHGFIPPTVNWFHPDPACALNLSAQPRFLPMETALINSHGLSGTNSCLVLERCSN